MVLNIIQDFWAVAPLVKARKLPQQFDTLL